MIYNIDTHTHTHTHTHTQEHTLFLHHRTDLPQHPTGGDHVIITIF